MRNPLKVMWRPCPAIMSNPVKSGMSGRHIATLLFLFFLTACALKPEGIGRYRQAGDLAAAARMAKRQSCGDVAGLAAKLQAYAK